VSVISVGAEFTGGRAACGALGAAEHAAPAIRPAATASLPSFDMRAHRRSMITASPYPRRVERANLQR
jgi:hypothetical protein